MSITHLREAALILALLAGAPALGQVAPPTALPAPPEAATGRVTKNVGAPTRDMVAAANPIAAEAGRAILGRGGSAADAAVAVQFVLNIVEPQSSGIGGGAFLLHYDPADRSVVTLDGRETAPAAATPERFLRPDGRPMAFLEAAVGGRSVGVPGTLRLLEAAHRRWGKLPWAELIAPAIALAEEGFSISPRLAGLLAQEKALPSDPRARALYYDAGGSPKTAGTVLKNPAFAATLRAIAERGAEALYAGAIAEDIVATVAGHPTNPGDMTLADLRAYAVVERPTVCGPYRAYRICGMGPPSSGAVAVQQVMAMLEGQNLARLGPGPDAAHWMAEAGRLAYADRALYLGDPAFLAVPVRGLTDPGYLRGRAALMRPDRSMGRATAGDPPYQRTQRLAPSTGDVENGTSHVSIVDRDGRAVALTTTIEDGFGARLMTSGGFLLNNELTDFNFEPSVDGRPVANRVEAGKRPRSSMAPTLVFDAFDRLYVVTGSPGGSAIINYVAKTLVGVLDWNLDPQAAVDLPNFGSRNGPTELERGTEAEGWRAVLEARGHEVRVLEQTSGIQAIVVTPAGLVGGADGRREGVAIGNAGVQGQR